MGWQHLEAWNQVSADLAKSFRVVDILVTANTGSAGRRVFQIVHYDPANTHPQVGNFLLTWLESDLKITWSDAREHLEAAARANGWNVNAFTFSNIDQMTGRIWCTFHAEQVVNPRRTLVALARLGRAAARRDPIVFFLIAHAQGVARSERQWIIEDLKMAEMSLVRSYELNRPDYDGVLNTAVRLATRLAKTL